MRAAGTYSGGTALRRWSRAGLRRLRHLLGVPVGAHRQPARRAVRCREQGHNASVANPHGVALRSPRRSICRLSHGDSMTEVAVVGAGLMGHALALVFALGGHSVRLTDSNAETLERAPGLMATALATLSAAGEADGTWNQKRLSKAVTCIPSLPETVRGAALVV